MLLIKQFPFRPIHCYLRHYFLMAFHGFFRLEEIVIKAKTQSDKIIQRSVVYLEAANGKLKKMQLVLRNFKTQSVMANNDY